MKEKQKHKHKGKNKKSGGGGEGTPDVSKAARLDVLQQKLLEMQKLGST